MFGQKTGGRQKGTPNKRKKQRAELIAQIEAIVPNAFGGDAHAFLMAIYKNQDLPLALRADAAKAALPFEKPRLSAHEMTGKDGGPIETTYTDTELVRWMAAKYGQDSINPEPTAH